MAYRLLYCVEGLSFFFRRNIRELPSFTANKESVPKYRFGGRRREAGSEIGKKLPISKWLGYRFDFEWWTSDDDV